MHILKSNTFESIMDSLLNLKAHRTLATTDHNQKVEKLKQALVNYKKYLDQMENRKRSIVGEDIQPWVPLLKGHQKASIYKDVKITTINKITDAKKEVDGVDRSVAEMKLYVLDWAKQAKESLEAIKTLETKIFILETAADADTFFRKTGQAVQGVADYELNKYFDLYRKGVQANG